METSAPIVIGLGHYSRVGKDTVANSLVATLKQAGVSVAKRSFAAKLKDIAHQLYGWAGMQPGAYYDTPEGEAARQVVLPAIGKTPVGVWIGLGDGLRESVYSHTWVDWLLHDIPSQPTRVVVIPDVRYPNEVEAIRQLGGMLVKVVRPGYGPISIIDKALEDWTGWDEVVGSTGCIEELREWAQKRAQHIASSEFLRVHPRICWWQQYCGDVGNGKQGWSCGAHPYIYKVFQCPYQSLPEARNRNYPCVDAREPGEDFAKSSP